MGSDTLWFFLRMILALPVVLFLAYLVIRYVLGRRFYTPGPRRMKLIEQLPLGPKSGLALVEVGGCYYLLAHQENSVTLLKELDFLPETAGEVLPGSPGDWPFGKFTGPNLWASIRKTDFGARMIKAWRGKS